jgi:hypothetical protein
MRRDNRLLVGRHGEQNGRDQIGQALADAGAGLDREVPGILQRPRHSHGHFLLLRAILEILCTRQQPAR